MPVDETLYEQTMTVLLTRTGLEYTCTITAAEDENDAEWEVVHTDTTRGKAFRRALDLARFEMRAELDAP